MKNDQKMPTMNNPIERMNYLLFSSQQVIPINHVQA